MALSPQQKRLVQLLNEGYTLRIVRSLINHSPVHAELFCSENFCVETVQWWRIAKMLRTRCVSLDTGNMADATQIVAAAPDAPDRPEQATAVIP
ncbi:hypothetical protein D9X30_4925 [Cupriavidus sp. U2]|uniref:hypothetical protein n=1 Tax=Cupriavidus sp. U2 TaxID=2920269 RepID=UPI00129E9EE5|nr:hypothetical protein [Cupriavidus sp. U2]KAI3589342.1 hypothetical protein D9X30_4925 [Cupriavidus sp. U2]